jgi:DNA-directed RNA polymerase subunit RPC12/RpoP
VVEVCSNCGKVAEPSDYKGKEFVCSRCGCDVSVVMSREAFEKLVKAGFGKKN